MSERRSDYTALPKPPSPGVIQEVLHRVGISTPRIRGSQASDASRGRSQVLPPVIDPTSFFTTNPMPAEVLSELNASSMPASRSDVPSWFNINLGPRVQDGLAFEGPALGLIMERAQSEKILGPESWRHCGFMGALTTVAASQDAIVKAKASVPTLKDPTGLYSYARAGPRVVGTLVNLHPTPDKPFVELVFVIPTLDLMGAATMYGDLVRNPEIRILAQPSRESNSILFSLWAPISFADRLDFPTVGERFNLYVTLGARNPSGTL